MFDMEQKYMCLKLSSYRERRKRRFWFVKFCFRFHMFCGYCLRLNGNRIRPFEEITRKLRVPSQLQSIPWKPKNQCKRIRSIG